MTHIIRVTADSIALLHPAGCVECAEGRYERTYGLTEFEKWTEGDHGVSFWCLYDADGEYADGLQLTYDDIPAADSYYPEPSDPQPQAGPVRGFPYSGGRWTA